MQAKREFRDRDDTEVAVLDALVDRNEDGMTVFELRSHVDAGIDELEDALGGLKADGLIAAREKGGRTVITVDERVVPDGPADHEPTFIEKLREKLPL